MKPSTASVAFISLSALLLASSSVGAATPAVRGKVLLSSHCSGCHALGRTGDSPLARAPPFRTLHTRYPIDSLGEALAEGILVGHPQMPEFRFSADEVADITTYLKSIQTK